MAKTINGDPVKQGQCYTTTELGAKFPNIISGSVVINGEKLLFITINHKYQNELQPDGIIHEPRIESDLTEYNKIQKPDPKKTHLFIRYFHKGTFLYLGELEYTIRYDTKRNKLFIKDTRPTTAKPEKKPRKVTAIKTSK